MARQGYSRREVRKSAAMAVACKYSIKGAAGKGNRRMPVQRGGEENGKKG